MGNPSKQTRREKQNLANELLKAGSGILERAQKAKTTLTGFTINQDKVIHLPTLSEEEKKRAELQMSKNSRVIAAAIIMTPPYNDISVISSHIGLTGAWGIVAERIAAFPCPVRCVINATYETPLLQVEGITSYRIPLADDEREKLDIYFDEVTERMHHFAQQGFAVVVHCMAGVSRSASIVIAYLMRYSETMKTLELAFVHTKSIRNIVRPNLAFLCQLAEYEKKLHGLSNCSPWREHTLNGVTISLPVFIIERFIGEYQNVFEVM